MDPYFPGLLSAVRAAAPEVEFIAAVPGQLARQAADVDAVIIDLKKRGTTILMATHQWERSARLSDVALVLEAGRVVYHGPPTNLAAGMPPC